jgi:hypothetical protein
VGNSEVDQVEGAGGLGLGTPCRAQTTPWGRGWWWMARVGWQHPGVHAEAAGDAVLLRAAQVGAQDSEVVTGRAYAHRKSEQPGPTRTVTRCRLGLDHGGVPVMRGWGGRVTGPGLRPTRRRRDRLGGGRRPTRRPAAGIAEAGPRPRPAPLPPSQIDSESRTSGRPAGPPHCAARYKTLPPLTATARAAHRLERLRRSGARHTRAWHGLRLGCGARARRLGGGGGMWRANVAAGAGAEIGPRWLSVASLSPLARGGPAPANGAVRLLSHLLAACAQAAAAVAS